VHLTPKEFDLLRELVTNAGKPVSHRRLLQAVWGPDYGEETRIAARDGESVAKEDRA